MKVRTLVPILLLFAACGDDEKAVTGEVDSGLGDGSSATDAAGSGDASGSADSSEGSAEDTSEEVPLTPPDDATVSGGATRVEVSFAPFGLRVLAADGSEVGATSGSDEAAFAPFAVGIAPSYRATNYYDPRLMENAGSGRGLVWCKPVNWQAAALQGGGLRASASLDCGDTETAATIELDLLPSLAEATAPDRAEGVMAELRVVGDTAKVAMVATSWSRVEGEGNFGLGEMFDTLDAAGSIREMQIRAEGRSESATNEVHVPVSFFQTTSGLGLFADQREPGAFDFGVGRPAFNRVAYNGTRLRLHLWAEAASNERPLRLLQRYLDLTGYPKQVPFWSLGPQWWRNENRDAAEVLDDARRAIANDIPSTVIWIDRPWSSAYHNWRFNAAQFPDPQALFDELRAMGHPVLLHHSPQLNPVGQTDLGANEDTSEAIFERYEANGWLVTFQGRTQPVMLPWGGGTGGFIDYSHPDAVADQQELIRRVTDLGAIGVKMDWDEYLQANVGPQRLYMQFFNGETNQTMHGWYSALYHRTNIEAFDRALGGPSFSISRSGMARDQVWNSCIWPGDLGNDWTENTTAKMPAEGEWKVGGLPSAYYGALSLGMSGYPCYGSDIGGYRGGLSTEEVLLRWLELGIFHPVTQLGGAGSAHMPWVAGSPYSADAVAVTRDYFKLRNQLTLYAYGELTKAAQTGAPFVRSLWFQYFDLPEARAFDREFLFGPDLLVAPVTREGETAVTLLLPPGGWFDWWSGERREGPAIITVDAPIGRVPLFFREGAVLPLLDPRLHSLKPASDPTVIGYDELRDTEVVVAATPVTKTLPNGVEVTVAEPGWLTVAVRFGAPAPASTEEDWFAPDSVLVRLLLGGTALADVGPATVFITDDAGTRELAPSEWSFDAARRQLQVRLTTDATIEIR